LLALSGCWSNIIANSLPCLSPFSALTGITDPAINDALRIVTGCLRPTPADNLPILAGIQPAQLRRNGVTLPLACRDMEPGHLLHSVLTCPSSTNARRLKSRHSFDCDKLHDPQTSQSFREAIDINLNELDLQANASVEDRWITLRDAMSAAAKETTGFIPKKKQDWFD